MHNVHVLQQILVVNARMVYEHAGEQGERMPHVRFTHSAANLDGECRSVH